MASEMADAPMNQSSASSETADGHSNIVSMARVMLGNPADACGDCDEQSFVKGFERGFECGWSFGFDQGLAQYKKDSCDGGEAKFEGCTNNEYKSLESTPEPRNWVGNQFFGFPPKTYSQPGCPAIGPATPSTPATKHEFCLLSDVALANHLIDGSSPIKEKDVFYDARSSLSTADYEDAELNDANPPVAPFSTSSAPASEELLDLFYEAKQGIAGVSASTNNSHTTTINKRAACTLKAASFGRPVCLLSDEVDNTDASHEGPISPKLTKDEKERSQDQPASRRLQQPSPLDAAPSAVANDSSRVTATNSSTEASGTSVLYNIPLAHAIRPVTPDFSQPPSARRQRPSYPALAGRLNVYALAAAGVAVVENPYRVLIGPLSASARAAWHGDGGKRYLRSKLAPAPVTLPRGGGARGGRDGRRGGGWVGDDRDVVGCPAGLVFCELVHDDDEVWYVRAMFESQERARQAVEFFAGYACGGSIMWAWISQEED